MSRLSLPITSLFVRAPWSDALDLLGEPANRTALRLSLVVSLWSLVLCVGLGLPVAWLLARVPFPGRRLVRALVTLPLVVPPVVGGVALLVAFGRLGLLGPCLDHWFAVPLPYTPPTPVLAAPF